MYCEVSGNSSNRMEMCSSLLGYSSWLEMKVYIKRTQSMFLFVIFQVLRENVIVSFKD